MIRRSAAVKAHRLDAIAANIADRLVRPGVGYRRLVKIAFRDRDDDGDEVGRARPFVVGDGEGDGVDADPEVHRRCRPGGDGHATFRPVIGGDKPVGIRRNAAVKAHWLDVIAANIADRLVRPGVGYRRLVKRNGWSGSQNGRRTTVLKNHVGVL